MKTNIKLSLFAISALVLAGCQGFDEIRPESGTLLESQLKETTAAAPSRADAIYSGMYTKLGAPGGCGYNKPDDFGFIMIGFSGDLEAADVIMPNSNYNWFSVCGELSSRTATYRNPMIRYKICYDVIAAAHDVMNSYDAASTDPATQAKLGEAYAIRAFSYLNLAPYFQFRYVDHQDDPCVPVLTLDTKDPANNPRASVKEVYDLIIADLTAAIEKLDGWKRSDKSKIDQQVAYGLRARAYLNMGKYEEALADAQKAAEGYEPASMDDVSTPFLYDINEENWMWGYDMTEVLAAVYAYATTSSWIRSFSGDGYSPACQTYCFINSLLYDKIPATDVRKGWWVDENLESPLLNGLKWDNLSGQAIASGLIDGVKEPFLPLTNVKFGVSKLGTTTNDEDWCWMRVEEMILIQAECMANLGKESEAKTLLENFVKTYRDPAYSATAGGRNLKDEIWFQRRVELWGEGFSNNDTRRLNKPLVRFHGGKDSNYPEAFRFNMTADDGWWLMRFPQTETNNNAAVVDNADGDIPQLDQNPDLRDGVTD
jgi:tetratricopeptide (TPR) repeat protein